MILTLNESTGKAQNAKGNSAGHLLVEQTSKYLDLGILVDGYEDHNGWQLAAGAIAIVPAINNLEWVRNIVLFFKGPSGGSADIRMFRINTDGVMAEPLTGVSLGCFGYYVSYVMSPNTGMNSTSGILGKSAKLTVKNNGASAADFFLSAQLLG